jgi:sulfoxide reductase heme-binding subunit YedZ
MTGSALWYLMRGTGVVSLVLLTLVVLLGVATRGGGRLSRVPQFVTGRLHRNIALLSVTFLAVHVITAVLDPFAPIRLIDAVLPFASAYRPVWLGLGALALDVFAALIVTSMLRRRLGPRTWRGVHWLAYAAWPVAVLHALGTGSDVHRPWMLAIVAMSVVSVLWAVLWRLVDSIVGGRRPANARPARAPRMAALALVASAPVALAGWTLSGPLAANWAARAGTPANLLHHQSTTSVVPARTSVPAPIVHRSYVGDDGNQGGDW